MLIRALTSEGFRNLGAITLQPNARFNVFHGENGQGKTNLLEAIYVLATLRSFRTNRLEELVRFADKTAEPNPLASGAAHLRARVEHRGVDRVFGVDVTLNPPRKQALCDGKAARTSDYFGGFNVVLFAPEDLRLPKGPPAGRRRFLDRAIWNTYPAYLDEVRTYERVLKHRNAVLRQGDASGVEELLTIYDERLAAAAAPLLNRRRRYLQAIAPEVERAFSAISGSGLQVALRYLPSPRGVSTTADDELGAIVAHQLTRDRRRDIARGFTHSGPHADDWVLELDGRAAELHASQGQTRALVLALKIAEIQHLESLIGDPPVLLLDDVSSELDAGKNAALFAFLRAAKSQVFISTTSPSHIQVPDGPERQDFAIGSGNITA